MARGFLSGVIWGGVVGAVLLCGVSVWDDQRPSEGSAAQSAPGASVPGPQGDEPTAPASEPASAPAQAAAKQPDMAEDTVPSGPGTPASSPGLRAPALENSPAVGADDAGATVRIGAGTAPIQPMVPQAPVPSRPAAPSVGVLQTAPMLGAISPEAESPAPVMARDKDPDGGQDPATVGTPSSDAPPDALPAAPKPQGTQSVVQPQPPEALSPARDVLATYAQPFENPNAKPLMSIVLIDDGRDLSDVPIGMTALRSFRYPLTVAVDVRLSDAAQRMARHRSEGYEVIALGDLNGDADARIEQAFAALPEAVALLDPALPPGADHVPHLAKLAAQRGRGLIGANTSENAQDNGGAAIAGIYQDFDRNGETPNAIRRILDQAARQATAQSGVIVLGRLRPDTITALLIWGLQDKVEQVALAPVSAILIDRAAR